MSRFDGGWIKVYRTAIMGDIGKRGACLAVWTWLIGAANYKPTKIRRHGTQVEIPRGSLVTSATEIAKAMSFTRSTVIRCLKYLKNTQRIDTEADNEGTVIRIINYEQYQCTDAERDTSAEQGVDTPADTEQDYGRTRSEEYKKERRNTSRPKFDLESAYAKYPLKKGKSRGMQKLAREIKTEEDFQALLGAIAKYSTSDDVTRGFIKHFSTFAGEWRDWTADDAGVRVVPAGERKTLYSDLKTLDDLGGPDAETP